MEYWLFFFWFSCHLNFFFNLGASIHAYVFPELTCRSLGVFTAHIHRFCVLSMSTAFSLLTNKFCGHVSYTGMLCRPDRMKFDTETLEVSDGCHCQGPKHTRLVGNLFMEATKKQIKKRKITVNCFSRLPGCGCVYVICECVSGMTLTAVHDL